MKNGKSEAVQDYTIGTSRISDEQAQGCIRIVLIDDQNVIRQTLRSFLDLEQDLEVVGDAEDGHKALDLVERLRPDIALIDIEMPGIDGLATTKEMSQRFTNTKVLVLSSHDEADYIKKALVAGARGYLLKDTTAAELTYTIRLAHKGHLQLGPGLFEKLDSRRTFSFLHAEEPDFQQLGQMERSSPTTSPDSIAPATAELRQKDEWSSVTQGQIDTLPRVWTRGMLYFLTIFTAVVLPWVAFSKVDETGIAQGRLEPTGKTLRLDAPVNGTITEIGVKEGETVRAGQVLLKFDSRLSQSDLQQARVRLEGQKNRLIQLRGMRNQLELTVSTQEFQSQAQAAEQQEQLALTQEALHSSEQSLILENNSLSVIQNDLERHQTLWNQGAISKSQLEEIKSKFIEQQKLLEQAQSGVERNRIELEKQHDASQRINRAGELAVIESQRQLKEVQSQIAEANSEMLQTQQQIQSAQFQLQQQTLRAPVNGTVFQFSVTNAGTVLREGQTITNIAPQGAPLILRAQMPTSQKSGFLREGMPVKLKFDSYPFQDYGIVPGHVKTISPDSKEIQTEQGKTQGFEIEVALDRTYIESQGDRHNLTPGQTATAEVVIRQRRVIDFILDPFKKLQKGGLAL